MDSICGPWETGKKKKKTWPYDYLRDVYKQFMNHKFPLIEQILFAFFIREEKDLSVIFNA